MPLAIVPWLYGPMAAGAFSNGDFWDFYLRKATFGKALPTAGIVTLPATGSESSAGAVATNAKTGQKLDIIDGSLRPAFAILNPEVMASLPDRQLENGIVDAFVHVCEQYLTYPVGALVQDGYAEAVMKALKTLADTFEQRHDNAWRQNLMWAANQALCGVIGVGVPQDWITHRIGVELTALWGIDHGRTLSIVQPWLLRELIEPKRAKLEQMGRHVFGLAAPTAEDTIAAIEAFYRSLRMPLHLRDAGVADADAADRVWQAVQEHGNAALGTHAEVDALKTERIVRAACS